MSDYSDPILSQSPVKEKSVNFDEISLPSEQDFGEEIQKRPQEFDLERSTEEINQGLLESGQWSDLSQEMDGFDSMMSEDLFVSLCNDISEILNRVQLLPQDESSEDQAENSRTSDLLMSF